MVSVEYVRQAAEQDMRNRLFKASSNTGGQKGAYKRSVVLGLGLEWPLRQGWKQRAIKDAGEKAVQAFVSGSALATSQAINEFRNIVDKTDIACDTVAVGIDLARQVLIEFDLLTERAMNSNNLR